MRGFTLTELIVVMVVSAILAAVALPTYLGHVRKTRRAAAQDALLDAASREEQFFLNNKTYTVAIGSSGLNRSTSTEGGYYTLSVDAASSACPIATCYALRATPQGSQAADSCGALTLNSNGVKGPSGCW